MFDESFEMQQAQAQAQTQLPFTFITYKFSDATSSASCLSVGETFFVLQLVGF